MEGWIPAFAGMTWTRAEMTVTGAGMTVTGAGMTVTGCGNDVDRGGNDGDGCGNDVDRGGDDGTGAGMTGTGGRAIERGRCCAGLWALFHVHAIPTSRSVACEEVDVLAGDRPPFNPCRPRRRNSCRRN